MLFECLQKLNNVSHLMLNSGLVLGFPWVLSLLIRKKTWEAGHLGWKSKGDCMQTLFHPSLLCFLLCVAACLINIACEELPRLSRMGLSGCFLVTWAKAAVPPQWDLILLNQYRARKGLHISVSSKMQYELPSHVPFSLFRWSHTKGPASTHSLMSVTLVGHWKPLTLVETACRHHLNCRLLF